MEEILQILDRQTRLVEAEVDPVVRVLKQHRALVVMVVMEQ